MTASTTRSRFGPSLGLAFASGAAALAHETLWTRRLVDVLGASSETFSQVVGAFFLGLAMGAWLASGKRIAARAGWRGVAAAEVAVGLLAIPVLLSVTWSHALFSREALVPAAKWLLPPLLVLPPTIAMGAVVPWMLEALSRQERQSENVAVWIYAANTLGGIAGVGIVLLAPVPELGLTRMGLLASGLNLLVAGGAWSLRGSEATTEAPAETATKGAGDGEGAGDVTRAALWLAIASGFLVLSLEALLQHQLAQVTINSQFSSGTVLGLVLMALAFSAVLLPLFVGRLGERGALPAALLLAAALCAAQPFLFLRMREGLAPLPPGASVAKYTLEVLELGAVAVCPTLIAAGLIFPLLLRGQAVGSGRRVGRLLAWNGLGGWLGTRFTQSVLAPSLGLWTGMEVIAVAYLALALIFAWRLRSGATGRRTAAVLVVAVAAMGPVLLAARRLPQAAVVNGERVAAVDVGPEGVVATVECGPGDWRIRFDNTYTLGGTRSQFIQEREALLPLLLHDHPTSVATLGVATGCTAAGVALHPGVERLDAVELSPIVLRDAERFFAPYNRNVFHDARAHFIHEDARWVMAQHHGAYDVVVGDLFVPWRTGEGRLFTLDHFQNVRGALRPDGLYCQWLPLFQLTRDEFDTIARTFREVFPDAFLLRGDFYCEVPIVALVGGRGLARIDWERVEAGCERLRTGGVVSDPLARHAEGVAMMVVGSVPDPGPGRINTLANSWLEWDAGLNILALRSPWFIGTSCCDYLRAAQRSGSRELPERLRTAQDAGQFFLELGLAVKAGSPLVPGLEAQIPSRLPRVLLEDARADWKHWPSRVRPG